MNPRSEIYGVIASHPDHHHHVIWTFDPDISCLPMHQDLP
jgi:hypothetical protein